MSKTKPKILLAEDDEDIAEIVDFTLREQFPDGLVVELCRNGLEALNELDKNSYDLIVMDLHMPKIDGITTIQAIRKGDSKNKNVPIVVLSGLTQKLDEITDKNVYKNIYVVEKPFKPERLKRVCSMWLSSS